MLGIILVEFADKLGGIQHIHPEHAPVEIVNPQGMFDLGVVCLGILTSEDTEVVDVVKQDVRLCSRSAEEIERSPDNTLYLVVIPDLDMLCAIGRNLHCPPSLAVGDRMKCYRVASEEIRIDQCGFLSFCLAGQLKSYGDAVLRPSC